MQLNSNTQIAPNTSYFKSFIRQPLEKRKETANKILRQYPDRVPVLIDRAVGSQIPLVDKHKYLVPSDITVGKFIFEVRKEIGVSPGQALFFFVNNILPPTNQLIGTLYNHYKNNDGFLYIVYSGESTFGIM